MDEAEPYPVEDLPGRVKPVVVEQDAGDPRAVSELREIVPGMIAADRCLSAVDFDPSSASEQQRRTELEGHQATLVERVGALWAPGEQFDKRVESQRMSISFKLASSQYLGYDECRFSTDEVRGVTVDGDTAYVTVDGGVQLHAPSKPDGHAGVVMADDEWSVPLGPDDSVYLAELTRTTDGWRFVDLDQFSDADLRFILETWDLEPHDTVPLPD